MTFVYLIFWVLMTAVLYLTKTIDGADLYIGACLVLAAEYIEAALKKKEVKE